MDDLVEAKRVERVAAEARRGALRGAAGAGLGRQAAGHLLGHVAALRGIEVVAGYLPTAAEIDPRYAMDALHGLGFRLCVPVTGPRGSVLTFRAWHPGAPTERGRLGIPVPAAGETLVPQLLIVPLVAFDRRGTRLGHGGGYYDRTLAALRAKGPVHAVGLAYAAQEAERLPAGPHDARLDAIVTEAGVIRPGV